MTIQIIGQLPIVSELLGDKNERVSGLAASLPEKKIAEQAPEFLKAISPVIDEKNGQINQGHEDHKMPKELSDMIKGVLNIASNMIPGGGIIAGILGKIF